MSVKTIQIALADDHTLISEGMEKIINSYEDMNVVLIASNGQELIDKLHRIDAFPDIILLDIEMPVLNGIDTLVKLKKQYPKCKVVMLSFHEEPHFIIHLIENGANGYIQKNGNSTEVVDTIRRVHRNGTFFNEHIVTMMAERMNGSPKDSKYSFHDKQLTKAEIKVLKLICREYNTQQIADFCNVSYRTIESHRYALLKKSGSDNMVGLIKYAIKNGFFDPDVDLIKPKK